MHHLGSSQEQGCIGPEEVAEQVLVVVAGLVHVVVVTAAGHPVVVPVQVQVFDCGPGVVPMAVLVAVMEGHTP